MLCIVVAAFAWRDVAHPTVVESSDSEASDIEATSPTRKDISSKFVKKEEVCTLFICDYI